jgi:hypothetical protein
MASSYVVSYERDLMKFPLDVIVLRKIITVSRDITLWWGGEYVVFYCPKIDDDIEDAKAKLGISAPEESIYPQSGSSSLLGDVVPLTSYDLRSFCDLAKSSRSEKISAIVYSDIMGGDLDFDSFRKFTCKRYVNYSKTITELAEKLYVYVSPSENILTTDGRRFSVTEKGNIDGIFDEYMGVTFEVDSLGTPFCSDITNLIELLYLKVIGNA